MRKVLRHPLRAMTAALTLVGAAVVFVVLFVPLASAESPSGKNEVRGYENSKGSKTKKVGRDQLFIIVGKNLDHATTVECWHVTAQHWDTVTGWDYGPTSKTLVDVDAGNNCATGDGRSQIRVFFDNHSPSPAYGPTIVFT